MTGGFLIEGRFNFSLQQTFFQGHGFEEQVSRLLQLNEDLQTREVRQRLAIPGHDAARHIEDIPAVVLIGR